MPRAERSGYPYFWGGEMKTLSSLHEQAFRSVKRVCYSGLDSVALRQEIVQRATAVVPIEAHSFATTDPDTGLINHAVAEGVPAALAMEYMNYLYPYEDAAQLMDQAAAGEVVLTSRHEKFWEVLHASGIAHEVNTVLWEAGALWGSWCMLREAGSPAFSEGERRFLRRIAPHVTRGLRASLLADLARGEPGPAASDDAGPARDAVGVLVLDSRMRVQMRNAPAAGQLEDLADVGVTARELPYAVISVLVQLHQRVLAAAQAERAPEDGELRTRGRSGRWYRLRASRTEPDAEGQCASIVMIEPVAPQEAAAFMVRLYGLSAREREVVVLAARGTSSKRIASQLGLSVYTVQDHLDRACAKVGVRGRKSLLARLFFDHYAPRL